MMRSVQCTDGQTQPGVPVCSRPARLRSTCRDGGSPPGVVLLSYAECCERHASQSPRLGPTVGTHGYRITAR